MENSDINRKRFINGLIERIRTINIQLRGTNLTTEEYDRFMEELADLDQCLKACSIFRD